MNHLVFWRKVYDINDNFLILKLIENIGGGTITFFQNVGWSH